MGSLSQALLCILWVELLCLHLLPILQGGQVQSVNMSNMIEAIFRNVLMSPDAVLPIVLSCQGRAYSPPTTSSVTPDLVKVMTFASTYKKGVEYKIFR